MNIKSTLRRFAAVGAIAAIAATGTLVETGSADADTVGPARDGSDAVNWEREVSGPKLVNGNIANGEVITVTNRLTRKLSWLVYSVQDNHPRCMRPVPNTSVWKVSGKTYTNNPSHEGTQSPGEVTSGPGWVKVDAPGANSWEGITWSQDYLLMCNTGELNTGGLEYSTTWVGDKGDFPFVGPKINVTPGVAGVSIAPRDAITNNDVLITVKNPDGRPGDRVVLTADGKAVEGCGNLELDENHMVTCTWVPRKAGNYALKAVISSDKPVTVTNTVQVDQAPGSGSLGGGSSDTGSLNGILFTGSVS